MNMTESIRERFVDTLRRSSAAEVVGAGAMEDGSITLTFAIDGHQIAVNFADMRMVQGSLSDVLTPIESLRNRYNRFKNMDRLTVEELKERGLPLYWNEAWLHEKLAEHKTYTAIARAYGYPSAATIASYAKRRFGIDVQKEFDQKRAEVVERYFDPNESVTQLELAREYMVAVGTVHRWIAEEKDERVAAVLDSMNDG